jgi:hydroxypyruvate reductase
VPESIRRALADPAHETLSTEDERLSGARYHIIASSQHALEAAAAEARRLGLTPVILSNRVEGEARSVGQVHAAIARQIARHGQPVTAPAVILSGGETTVRVVGRGQGGRNTEFLLAFALAVAGERGIAALAADTDGIDGTTHAAGAFYTPFTLESAASMELDPAASLADNDSFGFFDAVGNLVVTGPTRTNVNDFRAILVE